MFFLDRAQPKEIKARKYPYPYIFVVGVLLTYLLYHFSLSTPESTPLTSARWERPASARPVHAHTGSLVLQSSLVIFYYLGNANRGLLSVLFIHLSIYSTSIFFWAVQLSYNGLKQSEGEKTVLEVFEIWSTLSAPISARMVLLVCVPSMGQI